MDVAKENSIEKNNATQHNEVLQELGDCYCSVADYDKAQKCYDKAAVLSPDDPAPYVGIGVIALQKNLVDDAEISFKVACRLDRNCAKAYAGLGMAAQQKKDYQGAFDMYLKCLELDTDNLTALLGLFQSSCEMGSFEKVIHYLKLYLDMHPADTSVMFTLAALYMKDGELEQSRDTLLNVLALEENHKDAANLLEEVEHSLTKKKQQKAAEI
ncbi:MAG: tetratricopeptide repeat protein [Planctomycetes bacterium]|nr:tetratricopeptide repeat protein [Planctomycetota bacterium]